MLRISRSGLRRTVQVSLVAITLVGAVLRLHDLGLSAFRGDTIILWFMANQKVAPLEVLTKWLEVSGAMGQMPMPAFVMQSFLYLSNVKVTPAMVRLPFALFGIVTVPVAYWAGKAFLNRRFGLLFAALLALSPYHVYLSREAYFYAPLFLGYILYFWATMAISRKIWSGTALALGDAVLLALALFFCGYSQMTGLFICATGVPYFAGLLFLYQRKQKAFRPNLILLGGVYAVVLAPLLLVPWGPRQMLTQLASGHADRAAKIAAVAGGNMLTLLGRVCVRMGWGSSWWGILWVVLALGGAIWALWRLRLRQFAIVVFFIVAQVLLFGMSRRVSGALYSTRYLGGLFPFYLAALAYGLYFLPRQLARMWGKAATGNKASTILCLAALACFAYPSYLVTQLTGKPAPYFDLVSWVDSHLPAGTPILVDRWFEPWNELRAHPSTNVFFTFTIPNEPVEVYLKHRWRDTAKQFFAKYPDAAYLEIAKSYSDVPGVGPWPWPEEFFAHHVTFTNEAGLKLRHLGLVPRADFYAANTNRIMIDLYYNTTEDLIRKGQAGGAVVMGLYGGGWKYVKTQDYRDFRVLEDRAEIILANLTDQPVPVKLVLNGVALQGSKRVHVGDSVHMTFEPMKPTKWEMGPVLLDPGQSRLELRDDLWGLAQAPLLVDSMKLELASPPQSE